MSVSYRFVDPDVAPDLTTLQALIQKHNFHIDPSHGNQRIQNPDRSGTIYAFDYDGKFTMFEAYGVSRNNYDGIITFLEEQFGPIISEHDEGFFD